MNIESGRVTTEPATIPDDTVANETATEIIEAAKICPSCNYTSDDSEFMTCPSCGLVIRKYYKYKLQKTLETVPISRSCQRCGSEIDIDATYCPKCGKSLRSANKVVLLASSISIIVLLVILYQVSTVSRNSGTSTTGIPQKIEPSKNEPSDPSAPAKSHQLDNNASSGNSPAETVSVNPSVPSAGTLDVMTNTLGITVKKIVFASEMDSSHMPLNNLDRISLNEKKIVAHVKMLIPPEKTYQFTGKLFDGEGKLVLNYTAPSSPSLTKWYAWFYHDFDKTEDTPGIWKFVFLVNGEQVAEQPIEVTQ